MGGTGCPNGSGCEYGDVIGECTNNNPRITTHIYFNDFKTNNAEENRKVTKKLKDLGDFEIKENQLSFIRNIIVRSFDLREFKENLSNSNDYMENGEEKKYFTEEQIKRVVEMIEEDIKNHASNKTLANVVNTTNKKVFGIENNNIK